MIDSSMLAEKNKMKIIHVYLLLLVTQLISATVRVLADNKIPRTLDSTVVSVQPVSAVSTSYVNVGFHGTTLFQPSQLTVLPGDYLALNCYEDNLLLVKAAVNLSEIDHMPAMLICQKNSTLQFEVLDAVPHLYYSPSIPPSQRFNSNMMLALNVPAQSLTASTALAASHRPDSMRSSTPTLPPYPTGPSPSGSVLCQATGSRCLFSSRGLSNPTKHTNLPPTSQATRHPPAPTLGPSGAIISGANMARGLIHPLAVLGLASVATILIVSEIGR